MSYCWAMTLLANLHSYSKTAIYAEGVGLGASKGKDIGKLTEGYSGYLAMAQDSVRINTLILYQSLILNSRLGNVTKIETKTFQ